VNSGPQSNHPRGPLKMIVGGVLVEYRNRYAGTPRTSVDYLNA
jgi:hypothetical protein